MIRSRIHIFFSELKPPKKNLIYGYVAQTELYIQNKSYCMFKRSYPISKIVTIYKWTRLIGHKRTKSRNKRLKPDRNKQSRLVPSNKIVSQNWVNITYIVLLIAFIALSQ